MKEKVKRQEMVLGGSDRSNGGRIKRDEKRSKEKGEVRVLGRRRKQRSGKVEIKESKKTRDGAGKG